MLHITNGDNANQVIQSMNIEGRYLAWADVLHDGPVPAGLSLDEMAQVRANFIHHCGWASEFEALTHFQTRDSLFVHTAKEGGVVIWNSPELYDQLHLIQLLSWYRSEGLQCVPPELVLVPCLLGLATEKDNLPLCFDRRSQVTEVQLNLAEDAWHAFTSSNPRMLSALLQTEMDALPYLKNGLLRLMQEYPGKDGVSRTQRQVLRAVSEGIVAPGQIFAASQNAESPQFMGDSSFWLFIREMVNSPAPLLKVVGSNEFRVPGMFGPDDAFIAQRLKLTSLGEHVLAGEADWLAAHQIDRWIGGVHLNPENIWRWDSQNTTFIRG